MILRTLRKPLIACLLVIAGSMGLAVSAEASSFKLLLERDIDAGAGSEIFIASFDTFEDLVNSPPGAPGVFSGINIGSAFSVGGLAYDGRYRLLLERDIDAGAGSEIFLASFDTFEDLVNSPPGAPGVFSSINIGSAFSVGGFAYDGRYRLLLERDIDAGAGSEIFLASFDTFEDLVNSPPGAPGVFSGINIGSAFSVGGLAYEFDPAVQPPPIIPLPASWPLLLVALGAFGVLRGSAA